jgi:hypothetical protein
MRTLRLSLAVMAVLAVAAMPAATVADEHAQPIGGLARGLTIQNYENPMGCADWVLPDGATMPAPTHESTVVGVTTLLGPTTMTANACYSTADMFTNIVGGEWAMAGEGEDGLSGSYEGNCIPDFSMDPGATWECIGEFTITAGTGAYEGASGLIVGVATYVDTGFTEDGQMRTVPTEWRMEGMVES